MRVSVENVGMIGIGVGLVIMGMGFYRLFNMDWEQTNRRRGITRIGFGGFSIIAAIALKNGIPAFNALCCFGFLFGILVMFLSFNSNDSAE